MSGRPTKYKPEYCGQAEKLCALGAIDVELADFFGVSIQTLNTWKVRYPDFLESLKDAKHAADNRVIRSLYQKACGYTFEAEKIFQHNGKIIRAKTREHVPPSDTAAIFWLKNRQGWADKIENTGKDGGPIEVSATGNLAEQLAFLLRKGIEPQ